jgi:DNA-binding NarL/FixJ family response regulator
MNTVISWKEKNIIRLDDHQIVHDGFANWCKHEKLEIKIKCFKDPDEVFLFIVSSLIKGDRIDLFITDFAHGGLNGYEMCKAIRAMERALKRHRMPILLSTFYSHTVSPIKEGIQEGVFSHYLSLQEGSEETMRVIEEMMEGNP